MAFGPKDHTPKEYKSPLGSGLRVFRFSVRDSRILGVQGLGFDVQD